jgi:quinol monooxygenase YgiN
VIIIAGWIDVDPDVRDELVSATVPLQAATRDEEAGCEAYVISADPVVPTRVNIYEAWATSEHLEAHFDHPNFNATVETMGRYPRMDRLAMKYRVDAAAPVRGADGTPSATF